jgi:hypothetical protein
MTEVLVLKLEFEGVIKRMRQIPKSLKELHDAINGSFPQLALARKAVHYVDKEGDIIAVDSEADLQESYLQLKESNQSTIKFLVSVSKVEEQKLPQKKKKKDKKHKKDHSKLDSLIQQLAQAEIDKHREEIKEITEQEVQSSLQIPQKTVHPSIICDGCNMAPIIGVRYKCVQCPDYDLCENCEAKGVHQEHTFVKVKSPDQAHIARDVNLSNAVVVDVPAEIVNSGKLGGFLSQTGHFYGGSRAMFGHKKKEYDLTNFWKKKMTDFVGGKEKKTVYATTYPDLFFCAEWLIKNNSRGKWPAGVQLVKKAGDIAFEGMLLQIELQANLSFNLSVPIQAPSSCGKHYLTLCFIDVEGKEFGRELTVNLNVIENQASEEELAGNAAKMEKEGLGKFEACYEALVKSKGNIDEAKKNLKSA